MDKARYVIAVLLVVTLPPAVAYWFLVHPFIAFWRRLGARLSYVILAAFFVAAMGAGWVWRATLVGRDLGTSMPLVLVGLALYMTAAVIDFHVRRHLRFPILAGLPEIRGTGDAGALLNKGIYAHIRHPRYTGFLVGGIGMALFTNYLGIYVLTLIILPALFLLILLEERELDARFGDTYREYRRTVPRFIPRLPGRLIR